MNFKIGDTIKRKSYKRENYYSHRPLGFVWTIEAPLSFFIIKKYKNIPIGIASNEEELRLFSKMDEGSYQDIVIEYYDNARLLLTERCRYV